MSEGVKENIAEVPPGTITTNLMAEEWIKMRIGHLKQVVTGIKKQRSNLNKIIKTYDIRIMILAEEGTELNPVVIGEGDAIVSEMVLRENGLPKP